MKQFRDCIIKAIDCKRYLLIDFQHTTLFLEFYLIGKRIQNLGSLESKKLIDFIPKIVVLTFEAEECQLF